MGFLAISANGRPWTGTRSPSCSLEQLGVAQTCQVGHEPEDFSAAAPAKENTALVSSTAM